MSKKFNKTEEDIISGMNEAILYAKGQLTAKKCNITLPNIDVTKARNDLALTQREFASTFGISVATLRNWEQGRRTPTGAAKVLLQIIHKQPNTVKQVLGY